MQPFQSVIFCPTGNKNTILCIKHLLHDPPSFLQTLPHMLFCVWLFRLSNHSVVFFFSVSPELLSSKIFFKFQTVFTEAPLIPFSQAACLLQQPCLPSSLPEHCKWTFFSDGTCRTILLRMVEVAVSTHRARTCVRGLGRGILWIPKSSCAVRAGESFPASMRLTGKLAWTSGISTNHPHPRAFIFCGSRCPWDGPLSAPCSGSLLLVTRLRAKKSPSIISDAHKAPQGPTEQEDPSGDQSRKWVTKWIC